MQSVDGDVRLSVKMNTDDIKKSAKESGEVFGKDFKNQLSQINQIASKLNSTLNTLLSTLEKTLDVVVRITKAVSSISGDYASKSIEKVAEETQKLDNNAKNAENSVSKLKDIEINASSVDQASKALNELQEASDNFYKQLEEEMKAHPENFQTGDKPKSNPVKVNPTGERMENLSQIQNTDELLELIKDLRTEQKQLNADSETYSDEYSKIDEQVHSVLLQIREISRLTNREPTELLRGNGSQSDGERAIDEIMEESIAAAAANAERLDAAMANVENTTQQASNQAENLNHNLNLNTNVSNVSPQFLRLQNAVLQAKNRVNTLQERLDTLRGTQIPTQEYSELTRQLRIAENRLETLNEQQRELARLGQTEGTQWERISYRIRDTERLIRTIDNDMESLVNAGEAFTLGENTPEFQSLSNQLHIAQNNLAIAQSNLNSFSISESNAQVVTVNFNQVIENLQRMLSNLNKVVRSIGKAFISFGAKIASAAKSMLHFSTHSRSAGKGVNNFHSSLKKGIMLLLRYGLGIRSTYILINKLRTAVKEGYKNLAGYSDEINRSISSVLSSLAKLKNQLAATFQPIVSAVVPMLNIFIEKVINATVTLSKFFAALTGQEFVYKATDVQKEYVESLEDTTEAAKEAENALESYLSPLDDINRYEETNNPSVTADDLMNNSNDKDDPTTMFTEIPIESKIKDFVNRLKTAFAKGDFTEIGKELGNKLNNAISQIDPTKIGETMARVVNSGSSFVIGFLSTSGLTGLTEKIATNLNAFIENVNAEQLGHAIAEIVNAAFTNAYIFISTLDVSELGKKLAELLTGIFDNINIDTIVDTFVNLINKIIEFGLSFIQNFDPVPYAKKLADAINKIVENVDWENAGKLFSDIAIKLLDSLIAFFDELDTEEMGEAISTFLSNIDWDTIIEKIRELLSTAFEKAIELMGGLEEDFPIFSTIKGAFELINAIGAKVADILVFIWDNFISKLFENDDKKGTNIFSVIGQFFSDVANNDTAITFLLSVISAITTIVLILTNLSTIIEVIAALGNPFTWIIIGITAIITVIVELITYWDTLKEAWIEGVKTWKNYFKKFVDWLKNTFLTGWKQVFSSVGRVFSNVWTSIKETGKKAINAIIGWINSLISGIVNKINNVISMLNGLSIDIPDWLGGGTIGFNISYINAPQIPKLAQGAVIPPNKEFLAILGDQKSGKNIEAPENLIRNLIREELAFANVGGGNKYEVIARVGRTDLFRLILDEAKIKQGQTGRNPFDLV